MAFDRKAVPSTAEASEAGYTFEPRFPDGAGIGATITVCGPESRAARALAREQLQRVQQIESQARRAGQSTDPLSLALSQDADEGRKHKARMAATYTLGWEGFEEEGKPLAFSAEAAQQVYLDHPWLADQVVSAAQDLGNFVKAWSKPSSTTHAPSSGST